MVALKKTSETKCEPWAMRAIPVAIPRIITALIPHLRYRCGSSSARARLQKMTAVCPDMKEQSQSHWLEMTIGEVKFLFPPNSII